MTPGSNRQTRPRLATTLAVLCALALVGGLAVGLWMRGRSNDIEADQTTRAEVVQAAQRFIVTFNEFLFALALTATPKAMTMPRGTATLIGRIDTDWASMSAAGVLGALPIVVFALLVPRHLVRGLTMGAVK